MSSERLRRRAVAVAAAAMLLTVALTTTPVTAQTADEAAEQAAREILEARERANAAADAMFEAESRLDTLDLEVAAAEEELAELEAEVGELRSGLSETAIRRYVGSGQNPLMLFQEVGQGNDQQSAAIYTGAATGSQLVQTDNYEEAIRELDEARQDLERRRAETSDARERFEQLRDAALAEVAELERIEAERLERVAVQEALERQRQVQLEQERREQQQRDAERQATVADAPQPQAAASPDEDAAATDPATDPGPDPEPDATDDASEADPEAEAEPDPEPEPEPEPEPTTPTTIAPPVTPEPASNAGSGIVCPVAGSHSFADTWGAPRSGGRRHEGVDMIAPTGTPLVAVESGSANFKTTPLGGLSVWLTGASGTKYFYAHLSSFEGSSRRVSQGEVIGYNGATGNAGIPHLHFQLHPGGGQPVNPYPYVRAVC